MIRWGIDMGGTKIEGAVIDTSNNNEVLCRQRLPTEGHMGYDHVIGQIVKVVELIKKETNLSPERIGIGTPGSTDPATGLLKGSNSTHLNDMPLQADLKKALGMEVAMANDANCFALAEAKMGVVKEVLPEAESVFGIIMGTGVGGGLVVRGQILNGANGIAGEWGHNYLDASGGKCYCGKEGCVETIIAGPSLERWYQEQSGVNKKLQQIVRDRQSDEVANATIDRLIKYFGLGVSTIINMIDPDAVVIGGGVGNIDLLYSDGAESVKKYVFNPVCHTKILKPKLGDSAGVFGAAFL